MALTLSAITGLAGTAVLIELTPGPNMAYLAIVAATDGRRAGYAAVGGVALGLTVVGLAAAFGLAAAIQSSPLLYEALRWGGVAYLVWLAWQGWRGDGGAIEHAAYGSSLSRFFVAGLFTNLLNPKAAVFYVAMLPQFVAPDAPVLPQTLILSATFVAVATLVHLGIVTLAGAAQALLNTPAREQALRRSMALALLAVALWFAWSAT